MTNQANDNDQVLLRVRDLKNHFPVREGVLSRVVAWVKAVDGVSFEIDEGETLGLVGESGCGKTTVGHSILRLIDPTAGTVEFEGKDLTHIPPAELRSLRQDMQIIFQDPFSSLNPRMTVGGIIGEALAIHGRGNRRERAEIVRDTLQKCGLDPAYANRFPHEFSGGQRQRIGIARALALSPKFIVCDEPVSALDVSIQSQIINLLSELKERYDLAYLFIAHDLSVVEYISDRGGRYVPGQDRRDGHQRTTLPRSAAPLHPGSALGRAATRSHSTQAAHHPSRGRSLTARSSHGMSFSSPLSAGR